MAGGPAGAAARLCLDARRLPGPTFLVEDAGCRDRPRLSGRLLPVRGGAGARRVSDGSDRGEIDIHDLKEGARGFTYYDNRRAYRAKISEWAQLRAQCPFRTANLEPNMVERGEHPVLLPVAGGAVYDAGTRTATAVDGSTLHTDNARWHTGLDRDGCHDRIYATWTDSSGRNQRRIAMIPQRGWRPGYGETRAVIAITEKYEWDEKSVPPPDGVAAPTGEQLAELVNLSVPIAGEHAGNMVVVDARCTYTEWR